MKKIINLSGLYGLLALASGVFYREFTKFNSFTGKTVLSVTHVHLMTLGCLMFLIIGLFISNTDLNEKKHFKKFMIVYNIGLPLMTFTLYVRGILQVLDIPLSKALNASISGVAGISHVLLAIAFVMLYLSLKDIKKYN